MEETFTYDDMDRLKDFKMGNDSLVYTYGYGHQRIAMEEHVGNTVRTKRYVGAGEIETRSGNYGMTDDLKSYVNIDEENGKGYSLVDGFVSKRRTGLFNNVVKYDVHIAPGVTAYDVVSFKAVVGHELIHSFHYNLFGFNFDSAQSERVAYQYTIETYENAGYYLNAHQNRIVASQYGYSNIRPNHFYITPF